MNHADDPILPTSRPWLRRLERYLQLGDTADLRLRSQLDQDGWPPRIGPLADLGVIRDRIAQLEADRQTLTARLERAHDDIDNLQQEVEDFYKNHRCYEDDYDPSDLYDDLADEPADVSTSGPAAPARPVWPSTAEAATPRPGSHQRSDAPPGHEALPNRVVHHR